MYNFQLFPSYFLAFFAIHAVFISASWAATALDIKELAQLKLEDLLNVEVKVASKRKESVFDAPSSVTVFTRQEIQAMGISTLEELLNFVPGFVSFRESVFGDGYMVAARGRTTPQASYNVLFMINGQRINNDRSGGALTVNRFIPLHNVKQVEIIRGPGSALYGTSAFSGVVNVITADDLNAMTLSAGNLASREVTLNAASGGADWRVAVAARYQQDDGQAYAPPNLPAVNDPRQMQDVLVDARYRGWRALFSHSQRQVDEFYSGSLAGSGAQTSHNFLRLQYAVLDEADRALTLFGGYTWQNKEMSAETLSREQIQGLRTGLADSDMPLLSGFVADEREWTLGLEGHYRLNAQHELFGGLDWRQPENVKDARLTNYTSPDILALYDGIIRVPMQYVGGLVEGSTITQLGSRDIFSVYLQDHYQISEQWAATLGVRYDNYSDTGARTTPRFSLRYAPHESTAFKLLYGEAFRAPAIRQLSGSVGNPDLHPETVKTIELAWLQKYHNAQTTLTWFFSRNADLIDTAIRPSGVGRQFQNLPGILNTAGWELEAALQPTDHLSLRAAYSYLYHTEQNPRRFPHQTLSLIANYHLHDWNFNLSAYHHSDVEQSLSRTAAVRLDGYWQVNAALRYTLTPRLTVSAYTHNLLDEDYGSSVKSAFAEGLPNRGRTYGVGVEVTF